MEDLCQLCLTHISPKLDFILFGQSEKLPGLLCKLCSTSVYADIFSKDYNPCMKQSIKVSDVRKGHLSNCKMIVNTNLGEIKNVTIFKNDGVEYYVECKKCDEITDKLNKTSMLCHICGKQLATRSFPTHMKLLHDTEYKKSYFCDTCGKKYREKKSLRYHILTTHFRIKQYICDVCEADFFTKHGFAVHKKKHISLGEMNYRCYGCRAVFPSSSSLNSHIKTQHGPLSFCCEYCLKKFRWRVEYENHIRRHMGQKWVYCKKCTMSFPNKQKKSFHEKVMHFSRFKRYKN